MDLMWLGLTISDSIALSMCSFVCFVYFVVQLNRAGPRGKFGFPALVHFPNLFIAAPRITEGRKKFCFRETKNAIFAFLTTNRTKPEIRSSKSEIRKKSEAPKPESAVLCWNSSSLFPTGKKLISEFRFRTSFGFRDRASDFGINGCVF